MSHVEALGSALYRPEPQMVAALEMLLLLHAEIKTLLC
jgi:hypothetical protein